MIDRQEPAPERPRTDDRSETLAAYAVSAAGLFVFLVPLIAVTLRP
ncbi:hypothetical protein ACFZB9_16685 [Kitasatospora sp. NPDC008050]